MKKSHECEVATHIGPKSCGASRKGGVEALTGDRAGRVASRALWHRTLSRRSQNGRVLWDRMRRLINRWLPLPAICHPYPLRRMGVIT